MKLEPLSWWVAHRDRVLLGAFVVMFLGAMGLMPGPISAMREEHRALLRIEQVNCYNNADRIDDFKLRSIHQRRCITLDINE